MNDELLQLVRSSLSRGELTTDELRQVITEHDGVTAAPMQPADESTRYRLNGPDVLLLVGGLILYGSLAAFVAQYWEELGPVLRVVVTLGSGLALLSAASLVGRDAKEDSLVASFKKSLVVLGSVAFATGGSVLYGEAFGYDIDSGSTLLGFSAFAAIMSAVMYLYDSYIKSATTLAASIVFVTTSYASLAYGVMYDFVDDSSLISGLVLMTVYAFFAAVGIFLVDRRPELGLSKGSFLSLPLALALFTAFILMFTDEGLLWQIFMPIGIYAAIYQSIKNESTTSLLSGSIFLTLYVVGIAGIYFRDGGLILILAVSGMAIVGSGIMAQKIKQNMFKGRLTN